MKKIMMILLLVGLMGGCGGFRNEAQYNRGDWDFWMNSQEVAQFQRDQLALKKLKSQPVLTKNIDGVFQGYKGLVANLDNYRRVNIQIVGPEKKNYFLGPGQQKEDYLIQGGYTATARIGGAVVGIWKFTVGVDLYWYMNQQMHWYVEYDRN